METALAVTERRVVLSYAPASGRDGLAALLALDDHLADILRTTSTAMIGQMRLTWWHGALTSLDTAPPPAHPVLQALAGHVLPHVAGTDLATLVEGWEELLDSEDDIAGRVQRYAAGRGRALFVGAARVLGCPDWPQLGIAGEAWALAELAARGQQAPLATAARVATEVRSTGLFRQRWPRALRPLGAMVLLAHDREHGDGRRFLRALIHRAIGL